MKELDLVYERWRIKLFHTNVILIILVFFVEVLMYFVLKKLNLMEQSTRVYLKWFLIEPMAVSTVILLIGYILMKYILPNSKYNNYIPVIQMAFLCMVIACVHNIFSITLCLFCFPLFTTILFSDRLMTRTVGIISYFLLVISLIFRKLSVYRPKDDKYFWAEVAVSIAILTGTFIFCNILIIFSQEKTDIIHKGYLEQINMKEQLNRDQKTGLYGHTMFMNKLDQKVEMANKTQNPFAVAVIDIDNFKHVNDTYGHLKGDQVIIILAKLMKEIFNEDEIIARYGGEEFAIIFSKSDIEYMKNLLENLRTTFSARKFEFMEDNITISIGTAIWRPGWTTEQLFEAADNAMYSSKTEGKNKVSVFCYQ